MVLGVPDYDRTKSGDTKPVTKFMSNTKKVMKLSYIASYIAHSLSLGFARGTKATWVVANIEVEGRWLGAIG